MKTFKFILCGFLLITGITACSNEVDNDVEIGSQNGDSKTDEKDDVLKALVGKWKLVEQAGRDLNNVTEIYEFKSNYSYEYIYDIGVEEQYKHYKNTFSIEDEWVNEEELSGYITITYSDGESEQYHCWINDNTMTIVDKLSETLEIPCLFSPYQKFTRQ